MKLGVYVSLTETERDALCYFAQCKEASRYMVEKNIERAYSGVYKAIQGLQDKGLVQVIREEPNRRNPNITVEYYSLTDLGFYNSLLLDPVLDMMDEVAEAHGDRLPLILGKWRFFKGVEPIPDRAPGLTLDWLIRHMMRVSVRKNLSLFSNLDQLEWFRREYGREPDVSLGDTVLLEMFDAFLVADFGQLEREVYRDVFFGRDQMGYWRHLPPVAKAFRDVASGDVDLRNFFRKETRDREIDLEAELGEMRGR